MKKLLKLVVLLVVLVIIGLGAVVYYIDAIARTGIEKGATHALGVPTTLEKADVELLGGEFSMSGLKVANPAGFDAPHFLRLNEGAVAVSLGSLREDTVELPHLTLAGVDVHLEKKDGKGNFNVIMDHLKRFESDAPRDPDSKQFVIRKVEVRNVNAHVDVVPIGGQLTKLDVPIDSIVLKDVGSGGGVDMSELTSVLLKAVLAAIIQKGGGIIPADLLGDLQGQFAKLEGLGDFKVEVAGQALQGFGSVTEGLGEAVEDVGKNIGDEAGKALEGLGDLIGGGKKRD